MGSEGLKRSLSLPDVVALGLNGVIGSGIFLLPGLAADKMGPASLVVVLFGGLLCFLIALCFAEAGSHFSGTGGPYLYAREAFGDFVAFEVGWMTWCVRIVSWAALANAFAIAIAHFVPAAGEGYGQQATAAALIIVLSTINLFGAKAGAAITTFFTVAKLIPLLVFAGVGLFFIDGARFEPFAPHGYDGFVDTAVVLLYAFVGFEVLAVPAGEMKNPQRSVPIALVLVLTVATVLYLIIVSVSIGTLDGIAGHPNPVAAASETFLGTTGATLIASGIAISIFGVNAGSALISPRCLFALAENGQVPKVLGIIHPRYKTPWVANEVTAVMALVLAVSGSFKVLAVISVIARFAQYIPTCIAVLVLRKKRGRASFTLPGGPTIPIVATLLSVGLLVQSDVDKLLAGLAAAAIGVPFFFLGRRGRI